MALIEGTIYGSSTPAQGTIISDIFAAHLHVKQHLADHNRFLLHNSSAIVPSACGTRCCVIQTFLYRIFANRSYMWRHVLIQHNTLFRSKCPMLQLVEDNDLVINATRLFILRLPCHAYPYNRYINKDMHLIKNNSWHLSSSYMFRHRDIILRDSSRTKDLQVQQANLGMVFYAFLTEVFPCFFLLNCKANARVKPAKTGHGPHSS
jgi:hypothetical protein